MVAGGGGGGNGQPPGGGGAGGYLNGTLNVLANGTVYSVTVGDGGAVGDKMGYDGGDSSFHDVVAKGGGGGAFYYSKGKDGGSGGGGGFWVRKSGRSIIMNRVLRSLESNPL